MTDLLRGLLEWRDKSQPVNLASPTLWRVSFGAVVITIVLILLVYWWTRPGSPQKRSRLATASRGSNIEYIDDDGRVVPMDLISSGRYEIASDDD